MNILRNIANSRAVAMVTDGASLAGGLSLAALGAVLLLGLASVAKAAPGDFKTTDWAAAAPYTYDHNTGGGAFDDRTIGDYKDVVEQLEGGQFHCGDTVTYLVNFRMEPVVVDPNQTIEFYVRLLADSTGQTGAAHVAISSVQVNYGPVQAGDGPGGTDSAIFDDGGSVATLLSQYFEPATGPYTNADLVGKIRLTDLEAGESVVVRVDAKLGCKQYTGPTGNLQGSLADIFIVSPANGGSVNSGNQTIPFLQIGDIEGTGEPSVRILKTVTTADGTCPGVESLEAYEGDTVKYCYKVFNDGTYDLLNATVVDDNATPSVAADDFAVTLTGLTDSAYDTDSLLDDIKAGQWASGYALVELGSAGTLVNTALASGISQGTKPVTYTDSDTAQVIALENPLPPASISIVTTASLSPDCSPSADPLYAPDGAILYYCYLVTNTGGQALSDVWVTQEGVSPTGGISLGIGESQLLVSEPVVLVGSESAVATAEGQAKGGSAVQASDPVYVEGLFSSISVIVKASLDPVCGNSDDADLQTVLAGTTIYLCYFVTNGGETALSGVTVEDSAAFVEGSLELGAGESGWLVSEPFVAEEDTAFLATASGTDSFGQLVSSEPDDAFVDVVHPALEIIKTVSLDGTCPGSESVSILAGTHVVYCYEVKNTGDTALDGIVVNDGEIRLEGGALLAGESVFLASQPISFVEDAYSEAVASATDTATETAVESAPDGASVDVIHPALAIAVTVSLDGTCPGSEIANVLEGTQLTWCYAVTNTGDVPVEGISVSDDYFGTLGSSIGWLEPGQTVFLSASSSAYEDLVLTGEASGTDAVIGSEVVSNLDPAAVNVVHPGLNVDVTVSLDGTCPGTDSAQVISGDSVVYCYAVSNSGDTTLYGVEFVDPVTGELVTIEELLPGESQTVVSEWTVIEEDTTVSVEATASDEFGFPVFDSDSAVVEALLADLVLDKTAPEKLLTSQGTSLAYGITVTNIGEATAYDALVTDVLPAGVQFVSASIPSCQFDGLSTVVCAIGDVAPGQTVSFILYTKVTVTMQVIVNNAYVASDTPDADGSNNSDSASTLVAPGATRTIGFYSTHPEFTKMCLAINGGQIDLGFVKLANEAYDNQIDVDRDVKAEFGLDFAMGILNANILKYKDGSKRSELAKARMQAGRQVLAAHCNQSLLGGSFSLSLSQMAAILAGTNIQAILTLSAQADAFNNSGDAISLGVNPGPAVAKYPFDDPTDFND